MYKKTFSSSALLTGFFLISLWFTATIFTMIQPVSAAPSLAYSNIDYLKGLSLEELLQTKITSVSKKPERLGDATAAIFVITSKDLERSGIRSIPEAMRMVPGVQVARVNGNNWAISSRGFGDLFSDKLLVLMDGRSVYTPLFSGVYWSLQDSVIEDIERIEVIRGPGATLWGSNAVNGVINIITKSPKETQGTLISMETGSRVPMITSGRHGGTFGEAGHYRLYAKASVHDGHLQPDGKDAFDGWETARGGFKATSELNDDNSLTFQGDISKGRQELTYNFPGLLTDTTNKETADFIQANLISRWDHKRSNDSGTTLQVYYDYSHINAKTPNEDRHTFDIDFQHTFMLTPFQEVIWGLGYRVSSDNQENNELISLFPESATEHLYSGFIQDEIEFFDSWWLTLGTKLEHNDYSGLEIQPNLRLRWKPASDQTVWASVSRAVRTPSRGDHDLVAYNTGGISPLVGRFKTKIVGQDTFNAEELTAYEAGYRWFSRSGISLDLAVFYNDYDNLRSLDMRLPQLEFDSISPYIAFPHYVRNGVSANTYGFEVFTQWQPASHWKLAFGYSYLHVSLSEEPGTYAETQQFQEDDFPEHQFSVRSYLDLNSNWTFDSELYYVDHLSDRDIGSYFKLDLRLAFRLSKELSLSLSAENILNSQNSEFGTANSLIGSEVPRQFFAKIVWDL